MTKKAKTVSTIIGTIIILGSTLVFFGGAFTYEYFATKTADALLKEALF